MLLNRVDRRLVRILLELIPVALAYRSDRREILKAGGKLVNEEKYRRHARKAVEKFVRLGPSFVKLGQLLSARPDLLPQPYLEEFAKLQDEVPPAPFEQVRPIIEGELGKLENVFDWFDPNAVSGASLGQVYRAVYRGTNVVVKVNRPGVREIVETDVQALRKLLKLFGRFIDPSLRFTLESILDQFSETVREEMNYLLEARNIARISANLRSQRDVIVPKVVLATERVLILEEIRGIKVTDVKALDEAGIDRRRLARRVARLFFKMLLTHDIFHADPHPGNISVSPDGKIILYDFGMVGRLDEETRITLIRLYKALTDGDAAKVVDLLLQMGILDPLANRYVIRRGIELALSEFKGRRVEEYEVKALMELANRTIFQFPFKLPKHLVLYMRMSIILEGVCMTLDPNFRTLRVLKSMLEEEGLSAEVVRVEVREAISRIGTAFQAALDLAPMAKSILENYSIASVLPQIGGGSRRSGFLLGVAIGSGAAVIADLLFSRSLSQADVIGFFTSLIAALLYAIRNL